MDELNKLDFKRVGVINREKEGVILLKDLGAKAIKLWQKLYFSFKWRQKYSDKRLG